MPFAIAFLDKPEEDGQAWGEIVLGGFRERFLASLEVWPRDKYLQQWHSSLEDILAGAKRTALVTNLQDPAKWAHLVWWALYREGTRVHVQNQIVLFEWLPAPFDPACLLAAVRERETKSDEGEPISEWTVGIDDIRAFLNTPAAS